MKSRRRRIAVQRWIVYLLLHLLKENRRWEK